ncbi:HAD-IA family hydrolase [Rhodoferax sp. U2-2l]|uniref:HAD-IA family hydrolase n=1 Tax=Rhodoferax sp. U2-2l TaxID=2884000 RepID=UPI001D0BD4B5|nr:HAD-IA family hydrolase [Rhodoferax sp. U2-2l]MCB8746959.1 HAD-IA family hydrolase [Rhodoferax sp. U2-2l]
MASGALQALIFDVDGTLAETESAHLEAFNRAFAEQGMDWVWTDEMYLHLLDVSGGKERILRYWQQLDPALDAQAVQGQIDQIHACKTTIYENLVNSGRVSLRPGVLALIHEARQAGLKLAIATTTTPVNIAALLRGPLGEHWREHFAAIGDAATAPLKKPHPQVYLQVLAELDLPACQCLVIEDSSNGLRAATAAGLATLITTNRYTLHHDFGDALRVVPDLRQVTLAQLRDWQNSWRA